jgi:DNA end-binding protein Ku
VARPIWTGSISFGLVNVPVRLYTATQSHDIGFHEYEATSRQRIRYKRVTERSGKEIPYEKIVKGYEVSKGKIVLLEKDELNSIEPKKARSIDIEQFVELSDIGPDARAGADKPYELLRKAMLESGKVGVGRFVMRTKEYLATVRPLGPGLALETMFYADEIRNQREAGAVPEKVTVSPREVTMAKQLIEAMTDVWDFKRFKDTYRDRVLALIQRKAKGEVIDVETPEEPAAEVIDLMAALKASLAEGGHRAPRRTRGGKPRAAATRRSARKKRAA